MRRTLLVSERHQSRPTFPHTSLHRLITFTSRWPGRQIMGTQNLGMQINLSGIKISFLSFQSSLPHDVSYNPVTRLKYTLGRRIVPKVVYLFVLGEFFRDSVLRRCNELPFCRAFFVRRLFPTGDILDSSPFED
jgi:hypothetical protein